MAKQKPEKDANNNLLWIISTLILISLISSGFTAYACEYVLNSFQNSNTMVLLITDAGLKSDDVRLEHQLTTATKSLIYLRDIALAVVIGTCFVVATMGLRLWKNKTNG